MTKVATIMLLRTVFIVVLLAGNAAADDLRSPELDQKIEELKQQLEDRIEDVEDTVADLESSRAATQSTSQRLVNAFNPGITTFFNFLGRLDDKRVENDAGDPIDDRFNLREAELDLRAAVDPWADAVVIVSVESETPGQYEAGIEEGYAIVKKLPGFDSAPLGMRLKVGRYRPRFGRENVTHTHDLPQAMRSRSGTTFLGEEGLVQNGVSAEFAIPTPGDDNALTANFDFMNGGDIAVAEDNGGEDPAFLGHCGWFWDLADDHTLDIGASTWMGRSDATGSLDARLYGADALYMWKPAIAGEAHSFLLGGEVFYADLERQARTSSTPYGYNTMAQVQLTRDLYANARFDYTQELMDTSHQTRTGSLALSYYTSEFFRLRLGYERAYSDDPVLDNLDTVYFELNVVFGSHPAEPYWVNR